MSTAMLTAPQRDLTLFAILAFLAALGLALLTAPQIGETSVQPVDEAVSAAAMCDTLAAGDVADCTDRD